MSTLKMAPLCDCEGRKTCMRDSCGNSFLGSYAVEIYDCKGGTSCGYKFTNYCVCNL